MNRLSKLVLSSVIALPLWTITGCVHHHSHGEIVYEEPPVERVEVVGVAPSANHIWIKGHYVHRGHEWIWEPGHWEIRPHGHAEYVAGHWEHEGKGWVYVEGHWH